MKTKTNTLYLNPNGGGLIIVKKVEPTSSLDFYKVMELISYGSPSAEIREYVVSELSIDSNFEYNKYIPLEDYLDGFHRILDFKNLFINSLYEKH